MEREDQQANGTLDNAVSVAGLKKNDEAELIAIGRSPTPRAVCGPLALTKEQVVKFANEGTPSVYLGSNLSRQDAVVFKHLCGVVSFQGGMSTHVAQLAISEELCFVTSVSGQVLNNEEVILGERKIFVGDTITLDGFSGSIFYGATDISSPKEQRRKPADLSLKKPGKAPRILSQAVTGSQVRKSIESGADIIGICRIEHMLTSERAFPDLQKVFRLALEITHEARANIQQSLGSSQDHDCWSDGDYEYFKALLDLQYHIEERAQEILEEASGIQCIFRLLDPPLDELITNDTPHVSAQTLALAREGALGIRGAKLAIIFKEITLITVRAILDAASELPHCSIGLQIPSFSLPCEVSKVASMLRQFCDDQKSVCESGLEIQLGASIETPSAALRAQELTDNLDFLVIGHGDLSQLCLGLSRSSSQYVIDGLKREGLEIDDPFTLCPDESFSILVAGLVTAMRQKDRRLKIFMSGHSEQFIRLALEGKLDGVFCFPNQVQNAEQMLRSLTNDYTIWRD